MTIQPPRRRFAFWLFLPANRIGIALAPLILHVATTQPASAQSPIGDPAPQVASPFVVPPELEPIPADVKFVDADIVPAATPVDDPAALKEKLASIQSHLDALLKSAKSTESKVKHLTKVLQALQPPKAAADATTPKSCPPPYCPEEEAGEAAGLLVTELDGFTSTWLTKNPPNAKDLKNVEMLKIKMNTWDGDIQIKTNEINTLQSALEADTAALKGLTRELDRNAPLIFSTRFELSKAQAKQNANAISYWDAGLKKLRKDRATLSQEVKNKQKDALSVIRRIADLEHLIANLAHDRNLVKSIVSLIEASASQ